MKSKFKIFCLVFCAFFLMTSFSFAQENEEPLTVQENSADSKEESKSAEESASTTQKEDEGESAKQEAPKEESKIEEQAQPEPQEASQEKEPAKPEGQKEQEPAPQKTQPPKTESPKKEAPKKEPAKEKKPSENEDAPDVYYDDEDFVYLQNAPGDQFINVRIMPDIPLNFGDKLKVGGQITVGYQYFFTSWLSVGVEVAFGYNPTVGSNMFTYIPMTGGVTFLPTLKKFEFPITLNAGIAVENYLSNTFFPAFILRGGAGCYYRINESWSAGAEALFTFMPQWYFKKPEKNDYCNMASISAGIKYHF